MRSRRTPTLAPGISSSPTATTSSTSRPRRATRRTTRYIQKAIENYQKASQRDPNPKMKKLALEYLAAAYGSDKLNDPAKAEPVVPADHPDGAG